jgi:peroxiredoxin Q/BCP
MLRTGTGAPDFSATLEDGSEFTLSDWGGKKKVVLYFYPADFTMGCTKEACSFRDRNDEIGQLDAMVVGVSPDTGPKHADFRARHNLPFPLIPDPDKRVIKLYDADGLFGIRAARVTYVIDEQGMIRFARRNEFMAGSHADKVIEALKSLEPAAGG